MQNNEGTLVYSPIRPFNSGDTYATAFANEIKGGFHTVNTLLDRDNIPMERREEGMLCSVLYALSGLTTGSTNVIYQLIGGLENINWQIFNNSNESVSSSDLIISDQNTGFQQSGIKQINFIGNDPITNVRVLPNGNSVVDVWIMSPTYKDKFNQGLAIINDVNTIERNISSPILEGSPFYIGDWSGGTKHQVVSSTTITYTTENFFSIENNLDTSIKATIYRGDDVILTTHTCILNSSKIETLNNIIIEVVDFTKDNYKWKAKINVTFNLLSLLPNGGRFSIKIEHINTGDINSPYVYEQKNIFFDSKNTTSHINALFINENPTNVITRKISGVEYYTVGSQFIVSLNDIDYINDKTYPDNIIKIRDNGYGFDELDLTVNDLSFWNTNYDNNNATFTKNNLSISKINYFNISTNANITATVYDWQSGNTISTVNNSILVDTYNYDDNRIIENFTHEVNRLKSDYTSWNSDNSLLLEDDGKGLQIYDSKLIYPQTKYYTIYNPNKNGQPNYSGMTGDKYFIRKFWNNSKYSSNGIFLFKEHNLEENDIISGLTLKVKIEISDDSINWYNLNNLFIGGILSNGEGCRVQNEQYNLNNNQIFFTLGSGKFTKEIWFKITYLNNVKDKYIGGISLIGGNWI